MIAGNDICSTNRAFGNGVSWIEVREMLGHSSNATTSRYLHATSLNEAITIHGLHATSESSGGLSIGLDDDNAIG